MLPNLVEGDKMQTKNKIKDDINMYVINTVTILEWLQTGFGLVIGFIDHLENVATNNYDSLTELPTPKITVTTARIMSSQSSLADAR
jgi:hypothetical protein